MKTERVSPGALAEFAENLLGNGRCTFEKSEAINLLGISDNAFHKAAQRLIADRRLIRIVNRFYGIISPENRPIGSIPATEYIDSLMKFREQPYYVGVLSAAALHGAAHQAPQELQVVTSKPMPMICAGKSRVRFLTKHRTSETAVQRKKVSSGYIVVSTPESTCFDLLRYPQASAGLGNIMTVLHELVEIIAPDRLAGNSHSEEIALVQRLGYLLDQIGEKSLSKVLLPRLQEGRWDYIPLRPDLKIQAKARNQEWRILVNDVIEADL